MKQNKTEPVKGETPAPASEKFLSGRMPELLLLVLAAVLMLSFLGSVGLFSPDEPVYGETAKEMMAAGDLISPRIYGAFWYDKPPLFYWLEAAAYAVGGISEFTSRLPSALLAIGLVLYVYRFVRQEVSNFAGLASGVVLAASLGVVYLGKAAVTDMTLMVALSVTMISYWRRQFAVCYIFAGLAMLVKGPVGYAFPAIIIFLYLLADHRLSDLKRMKLHWGIPLALAVGLPWYIVMYLRHGAAFVDTFIGFNNITRFMAPEHPGRNSWHFFIPVLLAGMVPWTGALLQAVFRGFRREKEGLDGRRHSLWLFLNIWAWFIFAFFTASKTQLITYIAPMFIPIAILIGLYMDDLRQRQVKPVSFTILSAIINLGLAAGLAVAAVKVPAMGAGGFEMAAVMALTTLASLHFLWRQHWLRYLGVQAVGMVAFLLVGFGLVAPQFEADNSAKAVTYAFLKMYDGHSPVHIDKFLRPGTAFYGDLYGEPIEGKDEPGKLLSEIGIKAGDYLLIGTSRYKRMTTLEPAITGEYEVLGVYGQGTVLRRLP